jgi:hypothetical protein
MYKNVLNQCIVALFLWLSSWLSYSPTETYLIKSTFHRLILRANWYLSQCLIHNQFPVNGILINPLI